jgi:hypothetical protein
MADLPIDYSRRLYDEVRNWYQSADSKAQVALGIDGAFLAFLSSSMFVKPTDLKLVVTGFSSWTWALLMLLILTLIGSIVAAMQCIRSRIDSQARLRKVINSDQALNREEERYSPQVMWFFQMVGALEPEYFRKTLAKVDSDFELEALAGEIQILSRNVTEKHRAANLALLLAIVTLLIFLAAGISYGIQSAV